jgi:integrase
VEGEPDLDTFADAQVGEPRRGRIDKCLVEPCPRSCQALRLCTLHLGRWRKVGKPDQEQWAADQDAGPVRDRECLVTGCEFPATGGQNSLCDAHAVRFTNSPFDDPRVFVLTENGPRRRVRYDMSALTGVSRLEMQFVLQQRHDEQGATLSKTLFDRLVATLASAEGSLLDGDEAQWLTHLGEKQPPGFLRYARDRLQLLWDGAVMDWDDDTWDLRRALGVKWDVYYGRRLRFGDIPQPWLRTVAKRWARLRLASRAQCVVYNNVRHVALLGQFLEREGVQSAEGLTRDRLEGFLAWLRATPYKENTQAGIVAAVRTFLDDCATHAWDTRLPRNARLFPGEGARFRTGLPRFISEDVMCQLEDPANMARWDDPTARNLFIVMRETGKRAGEVVKLGRDPVLLDSTGAPCLLYHDYKGRRDAIVPISDLAAAAIRDQQRIAAQENPTSPWLFPRPGKNADGSRHYTTGTFNDRLNRWMRTCEVKDAAGNPVTVSSHQFRHTMATRMLNLGVPQHIVQQMLGHARADTVATYARLSDRTLRREFDRYQQERVNIRGEVVSYSDTSPTAEAEWIKHRISKALQTLPNGECGRPIQQTCPHPNACLTCDDFLTDGRHLESHRDQLERTRKLIAVAEGIGNARMVEMNRQVETNLVQIVSTIERRSQEVAPDAAS